MKRILTLCLVAVLALSLCACGSNPYEKYEYINKMLDEGNYEGAILAIYQLAANQNTGGNGGSENQEKPTEEEIKMLDQYQSIYNCLESYNGNGGYADVTDKETGEFYSGQKALQFCYEKLAQLGGIDKWADSDYVKDDWNYQMIKNWDRQVYLDGFAVVENVILEINSTKKDNLGNVSNNSVSYWTYNADGTISYASRENGITPFTHTDYNAGWREYDAQGRLVKKRSGWSLDSINAIVTYTYDAAGNLTKEHVKTNSGEQEYTYHYQNGRLAKIAWQEGERYDYTIEYFYDAAGNLIKEEWTEFFVPYNSGIRQAYEKKIMEYVYANGKRVSGTYTMQALVMNYEGREQPVASESIDQYTYTCDEQGRVLTATVIPGDTVGKYGEDKGKVISKAGYESKTYEYVYGNYYIYTPAS